MPLRGLTGRCRSDEATHEAWSIAGTRDSHAGLVEVSSAGPFADDLSASRWQLLFDLPQRMATMIATVAFIWSEAEGRPQEGVALIRTSPFPAPGSELERMALAGDIPPRRIRALWRHQMDERHHLPAELPPAGRAVSVIGEPASRVRAVRARWVPRRGVTWIVTTPSREYRVGVMPGPTGLRCIR